MPKWLTLSFEDRATGWLLTDSPTDWQKYVITLERAWNSDFIVDHFAQSVNPFYLSAKFILVVFTIRSSLYGVEFDCGHFSNQKWSFVCRLIVLLDFFSADSRWRLTNAKIPKIEKENRQKSWSWKVNTRIWESSRLYAPVKVLFLIAP